MIVSLVSLLSRIPKFGINLELAKPVLVIPIFESKSGVMRIMSSPEYSCTYKIVSDHTA
jgi:hypothetical protein